MTHPTPTPEASDHENRSVVDLLNHEIRTPLTMLMGHAEVLAELGLCGQAAHSVAAISAAAARLARLADVLSRMADTNGIEAELLRSAIDPGSWDAAMPTLLGP